MNATASTCLADAQTESASSDREDIQAILSRRSDLSTFVVHLTRDDNGESARDRLKSIVKAWKIKARNLFGSAVSRLKGKRLDTDSQKCVCFTETPLEYLYLLLGKIKGRRYDFGPYGVAITKKLARRKRVNPVWYVDITRGHEWLMTPINDLIESCDGAFDRSPVSKITPFIEQMGTGSPWNGNSYRKEFWWEREWRHVGNFTLPERVILICPEGEHADFEKLAKQSGHPSRCVDPEWGLEQIIARLAGFTRDDVEIL